MIGDYSIYRDPDHLINENVSAGVEGMYHSTTDSRVYASFTANSSYNIADIQSIVLYDRLDGNDQSRIVNVKIELFKDNQVMYSYNTWMMKRYIRIDGPAILKCST